MTRLERILWGAVVALVLVVILSAALAEYAHIYLPWMVRP